MPIIKVNAKPLIKLLPNQNKIVAEIKLVTVNPHDEKVFKIKVDDGTKIERLINEAIGNAGWTGENLIPQLARWIDPKSQKVYDVSLPLSSEKVVNKRQYEVHLTKKVINVVYR